ncbi:unnamed protein product [Musa acuminata var. zebrina]
MWYASAIGFPNAHCLNVPPPVPSTVLYPHPPPETCACPSTSSSPLPPSILRVASEPFEGSCGDMGDSHRRPGKRRKIGSPAKESRDDRALCQDLIDDLPDECLLLIFSLLPAPRDRCRCAAVSRKWLALQVSMRRSEFGANAVLLPEARQEMSRCIKGGEANDWRLAAMAIGIDACEVLTHLSVMETLPSCPLPLQHAGNHRHISDVGLFVIAQACTDLRSLALRNCIKVSDRGLAAIAQNCSALKNLELTNAFSVTDRGLMLIASGCPNLASLRLTACPSVTDRSLVAFSRHSTLLNSFAVAQCPLITDHGILSIVVLQTKLETLKISSMKLGDKVVQAIACHRKEIKLLSLEKVWGSSVIGYSWIAEASGLRALSLDACAGLTDGCFVRASPSISFAGLTKVSLKSCPSLTDLSLLALTKLAVKLETLHLENFRGVFSYRGLVFALENCSHTLKELNLVNCGFYGHGTEQQEGEPCFLLPQRCPALQTVKLEECEGLGDGFVVWVGQACKSVTDVSFVRMGSITDRGITSFLKQLKGWNEITRVDLSGCTRLGDRSVWAVTRECKGRLRSLALKGCGRVTDRGASVITRRCCRLVELDLGGCNIGDEAVEKLVEGDPSDLESLSLAGCAEITDRTLQALDEYGGLCLNRLNLTGCPRLSRSRIHLIKPYIDEVEY